MTIKEACEQIKADCKDKTPYAGIMSRSVFCKTLRNAWLGKAKISTIEAFLRKFGYVGEWNEWHKTGQIPLRKPPIYTEAQHRTYAKMQELAAIDGVELGGMNFVIYEGRALKILRAEADKTN